MTFESEVMRAVEREFPGLFKGFYRPEFATTSTGQSCAVFINRGLTCTDVAFYFWDSSNNLVSGLKEKIVEKFLGGETETILGEI